MIKNILIIMSIIIFYFIFSDIVISKNIIPEDAIRIRVIPNSNEENDIKIKEKVVNMLKKDMYNLLYGVEEEEKAKEIINNNIDSISKKISHIFDKNNYQNNFSVNFGLNYFPKKEYKGIKYNEGYYESLVVKIGEGKGDNWWCVLFPTLCLIEENSFNDVEYTTIVKEILD